MNEQMNDRLDKFETMLQSILKEYEETEAAMARLRSEGKVKTVTYRQLMGNKLMLRGMLDRYRVFGLLDNVRAQD